MNIKPGFQLPYSTYPYDVTSPGPDQRPGKVVPQQLPHRNTPEFLEPAPPAKKKEQHPADERCESSEE